MKRRGSLINKLFNDFCFPILRDNYKFMLFASRVMGYKNDDAEFFLKFKQNVLHLSNEELSEFYCKIDKPESYTTDIVDECYDYIFSIAKGLESNATVLDISCGSGYLASKLAELDLAVVGIDFCVPKSIQAKPNLQFKQGDIQNIDYEDQCFDLVISAHTLEHVIDINKAISELRRVCKNTLIIILPCQKEYKYMYDSHVHFFPYCESFERIMLNPNAKCWKLGGDIVYVEQKLRQPD